MAAAPPFDASGEGARRRAGEHRRGLVGSSSLLGHTLPEGTKTGGLEITGLIGEGGFGIVYLAYDPSLQRELAVKEYMPSSLASRSAGSLEVTVKSERHLETFQAGLRSFVNEARLLAKFDHPSLLKVYRFWEANGTAYMSMPYYEGPTLKAARAAMARPPDEQQLHAWLLPLLDALTVMHEAHCYHRDIAPDNILLTKDGPLLLDFGAARRVIGDMTHALTVVLKPGYAPIEQYGDSMAMTQGAWTDLYALACVVHYVVSGKTPPASLDRMMGGDLLEPFAHIAAGRYSCGLVRAIDAALRVMPRDRPQDIPQFRALMGEPGLKPSPSPEMAVDEELVLPPTEVPTAPPPALVAAPPPTEVSTIIGADRWSAPMPSTAAASTRHTSVGRRMPWLGFAAMVGLLVATVGGIWVAKPSSPARTPTPVDTIASPAPPAPSPPQVTVPGPEAVPSPPTPEPPALASDTGAPDPASAAASAAPAVPPVLRAKTHIPAKPPPAPTEVQRRAKSTAVAAAPPVQKAKPSRCSDILQKASLESLTEEEAAFLRKECR